MLQLLVGDLFLQVLNLKLFKFDLGLKSINFDLVHPHFMLELSFLSLNFDEAFFQLKGLSSFKLFHFIEFGHLSKIVIINFFFELIGCFVGG